MNIKTGYKQTEIGVIPEDWEVELLGDLTTAIGDGIHSTPKYVNQSEFYFVNGNNLVDDEIKITATTQCVSETEYKNLKKPLSDRTILFSINGTIGNLAFYNGEQVVLGKSAAYLNISKDTSKEFIAYSLKSRAISLFFENELTGSTIKNLSLQTLRSCPIPLPKTQQEQTAIAAALSDVDALMGELDKLIAKKRDIKQATMQQLLTGKKRLAGFSGEWEVKAIQDIAFVGRGRVISHAEIIKSISPSYPVYSSQTSDDGVMGYIDTYDFEGDYVTWTTDGANAGTVFARSGKFNCTNVCGTIKLHFGYNHRFISAVLGQSTKPHVSRHLGNPKLMNDVVKKIEIRIPNSLEEQTAIATILSDMDAEISELEARRAKTAQLKQGMMQELLTGRIRLNSQELTPC